VYRLNNSPINNSPIAWRYDLCGLLFSISVADAERSNNLLPPAHIKREFRVHSCRLQLSRKFRETH